MPAGIYVLEFINREKKLIMLTCTQKESKVMVKVNNKKY